MNYGYTMSPADYAAVNGNNGGLFGNNNDWLAALFLLPLFGGAWGGFGGFGGGIGALLPWLFMGGGWGGNNCGGNCATQADLAAGFNNSAVLGKLNDLTLGQAGIQQTLCQGFNGVNTAVLTGVNGIENAICNQGYQNQQGFNEIARQIGDCCCSTGRAIDNVRYDMGMQACETRHQASDNTRDVIDNQNAGIRAVLEAVRKIGDDAKDARIAEQDRQILRYQFLESQSAQNAYLIGQLRPSPIPSYRVPNPYCCNPNPCDCNGGW